MTTPENLAKWNIEIEEYIDKHFIAVDRVFTLSGTYAKRLDIEKMYLEACEKRQEELGKINHERMKFKDQVIDTCKRAENAEKEIERLKRECSSMGRLLQSGVVYTYKEIEERKLEITKLKELIERAIKQGLIQESCSENDWDVACDDWLKEAEEVSR